MRRWRNLLPAEGNAGVICNGKMNVLVQMGGIWGWYTAASTTDPNDSVYTCCPGIIVSNVLFPFKGVPIWMINFIVILLMPQLCLPLF